MKKSYIIILILAYLLLACNSKNSDSKATNTEEKHKHNEDRNHDGDEHDHDHDGDEHDHKHEDEISEDDIIILNSKQAEILGVETKIIEPGNFHQVIKTSGQILSAQGDEKTMVATVNGIVGFSKNPMNEGTSVRNGESLFTITSKKLADGDPAIKAKNQYQLAQQEFERAEKLIKDKLISQREYNEIKLNYENAQLSYNALSSGGKGNGVSVASPLSGFLKSVLISDGQFVSVGEPLAVITQIDALQLKADVPQKYYSILASIQSANIQLPHDKNVYELAAMQGQVLSYGKSLSNNDYYIPLNFKFKNIGNIIPGSFVEVFLLAQARSNVLNIPKSALVDEQGTFFVYVNLHDDEYARKPVEIGDSDGINVEILSGLKAGESVVIKGAYLVKLSKSSEAIPHGHTH